MVRSRARSKNEVWSQAGCPYNFFAGLKFPDFAKTHIFQNKMNLSILGHTPFCLGRPNTLLRETAKPRGHPKCEIVKTESTPHKLNWIVEGVAVVRQSRQHSGLTQASWHTWQTHILISTTCSHHTHVFFGALMVVVQLVESFVCDLKWKSKHPFARSARIVFGWFLGLGT